MKSTGLSRRRLMQIGIGATAVSALTSTTGKSFAQTIEPDDRSAARSASVNNTFLFLDQMMDAYAQGSTLRLCQSYRDQITGGSFFSTAFAYDNALLVLAYLARGRAGDLARARIIGDALLYAQQQRDHVGDGRFRQAYFAGTADSHGEYVTNGLSFFRVVQWGILHGPVSRWRSCMQGPETRLI